MFALVITDFIIWTPIAVIGLTGVLLAESLINVQTSKYLMIFIFPINAWVNPLLYSILQPGFRNRLCDLFAQCGPCKEFHRRRKARANGVTPSPGTRMSIIGSISYLLTPMRSLFSKCCQCDNTSSVENPQKSVTMKYPKSSVKKGTYTWCDLM